MRQLTEQELVPGQRQKIVLCSDSGTPNIQVLFSD